MSRAYVLRTCNSDMTSYGGFVWPESGPVEAPDWEPTSKCGNGLHGLLWGKGDGRNLDFSTDSKWLVAEVDDGQIVDLIGKVKFPAAKVVFCGNRHDATQRIVDLGASDNGIVGRTATAGDCGIATAGDWGTATVGYCGIATVGYGGIATAGDKGTATAGDCGIATAGDCGIATAGYRGIATVGYGGIATAGDKGTATAGDCGIATAGYCGIATAGYGGIATAGDGGIISIKYFDSASNRYRVAIGYVGENGICPNVAYVVRDGLLVPKELRDGN